MPFRMDVMDSYVVSGSSEMLEGTHGDLYYYIKVDDIDVSEIHDSLNDQIINNNYNTTNSTGSYLTSSAISLSNNTSISTGGTIKLSGSLMSMLQYNMQKWYNKKATLTEKSELFYRFLFNLQDQLNIFSENLFNELETLGVTIDRRLTFDNLLIQMNDINNHKNSSKLLDVCSPFEESNRYERATKRLKQLLSFIDGVKNKYTLYKKEVNETLDEIMLRNVDNDLNNARSSLIELRDFNTNIIGNSTNAIGTKKNKITRKDKIEKKRAKRMLNKSIQTTSTFIPKKDISCFISGGSFEMSGEKFNYKIQKKEQYKILQIKEQETRSVHIPYNLDMYTKKGEYLANLCITFKGCPIFDQILSVYLMLSSNQEKEMLDKCNFYKKSELFHTNDDVKNFFEERSEGSELAEAIREHIGSVSGLVHDNDNQSLIVRNQKKEQFKKHIDKILFRRLFEGPVYDMIFNRDVSWDELTDYYSISREGSLDRQFGNGGRYTNTSLDYIVNNNLNRLRKEIKC